MPTKMMVKKNAEFKMYVLFKLKYEMTGIIICIVTFYPILDANSSKFVLVVLTTDMAPFVMRL